MVSYFDSIEREFLNNRRDWTPSHFAIGGNHRAIYPDALQLCVKNALDEEEARKTENDAIQVSFKDIIHEKMTKKLGEGDAKKSVIELICSSSDIDIKTTLSKLVVRVKTL